MPYSANVLKVIIASPGDVAAERKIVTEEIYRWNDAHAESRSIMLQPIKWETHSTPRLGQSAQGELNEQIADQADILVGIFGTRVGTPTERHVSGTVEEIKNHVAAGKTAKVYFSDAPVSPSSIDPDQYRALQDFKEECRSLGLYATYSDVSAFQRDFKQHLDIELNNARYHWIRTRASSDRQSTEPSPDAINLLSEAARCEAPITIRSVLGSRDSIFVKGQKFTDGGARSTARWKEALNELERLHFVKETTSGSGLFEVTESGYRAFELSEALMPVHVNVRISGPPNQQQLEVQANKSVTLSRIDYLHSTETCIVSQEVDRSGESFVVGLQHPKLLELNNSSRPDLNTYDRSGPAKLRLVFKVDRISKIVILPVHLEPKSLANQMWITLTGSVEASL